jgi:hypothetical protein
MLGNTLLSSVVLFYKTHGGSSQLRSAASCSCFHLRPRVHPMGLDMSMTLMLRGS